MKRYRLKKVKAAVAATAPSASVAPVGVATLPSAFTTKYAGYESMITAKPGGGYDTRAADMAIAGIKPATAVMAPTMVSSSDKAGNYPSLAKTQATVPAPLESWGTKDVTTGWVTGVNPSVDLAHLPASMRELSVAPTGRIYGGNKRDVDFLATSMAPEAVAWRSRREGEGAINPAMATPGGTGEGGPYGNVPGYKFIQDFSSQDSSVKSIMKMPTLQVQAINAGKEAQPPGWKGEGIDIFGGSTPSRFGLATDQQLRDMATSQLGEDVVRKSSESIVIPGILTNKQIAALGAAQHAKRKTIKGKPKKHMAKRSTPKISVRMPSLDFNIPGLIKRKKK